MCQGTGIGASLGLSLLLGLASAYTFSLVGHCCDVSHKFSFKQLCRVTGIRGFESAVALAIALKTLLTCLSYSIVIRDGFSSLMVTVQAPQWLSEPWLVLVALTSTCLLPLCLLKNLSSLWFSSLLGSLCMVYTVTFMAIRLADSSYSRGGSSIMFFLQRLISNIH